MLISVPLICPYPTALDDQPYVSRERNLPILFPTILAIDRASVGDIPFRHLSNVSSIK